MDYVLLYDVMALIITLVQDKALIESANFEEFWQRDVEESVRQRRMKSFIEEAVLQVSDWGFSLADLQMRRRCPGKGILPWLKSLYRQAECELTGFSGPIHIWQVCLIMFLPLTVFWYL